MLGATLPIHIGPFRKGTCFMKILERANNALTSLYLDCMTTIQSDKKALGISGATGIGIGVVANMMTVALASSGDATIRTLSSDIVKLLGEIYTSMFSVISILTAILVVAALVVRMNGNQQRAAQATQWLTRIIICYVAINCVGLIMKVIENTTKGYNYKINQVG